MKYFSTFSGIGGFELGIGETHECVGFSEIDKYATAIYQKHFPDHKQYGDITKINAEELPDFDLLVGGFPCQAFSIAGKRKGFDDTRGTLFFDVARIAKAKEPLFLLLENVKGLASHDGGKTLEVILETLQELGYYVNYEIHNSKDHGVPQNRERIIFLCRSIKLLESVGQSERMTSSESIIQEYLFQLLLNNLGEVKKLQGLASKDSILGYLLLREIKEKLPNPDISESILGGISTLTAENISQLKEEDVWQNIDMCLKNIWVYDSNELSKYTTSTAIKQIIDSKTYTYSRMLQAISLATVLLRSSQKNLWNEMLSDLIVIQENTKYARINNENEEAIVTESGTAYITSDLQDFQQYFTLSHLRGTPRPQVFPFIGTAGEGYGVLVPTIRATHYKSGDNQPLIRQLNNPTHSNDRVYGADGISPTLNTMQGGNRQPFVLAERGRYNEEGKIEQQMEPRFDGLSNTLTSVEKDNRVCVRIPEATKQGYAEATVGQVINLAVPNSTTRRGRVSDIANTLDTGMQQHTLTSDMKIRRLTPTECERLQGFPDGWTEGVSDTQRYKTLGNAVTVNVIRDIVEKLFTGSH